MKIITKEPAEECFINTKSVKYVKYFKTDDDNTEVLEVHFIDNTQISFYSDKTEDFQKVYNGLFQATGGFELMQKLPKI